MDVAKTRGLRPIWSSPGRWLQKAWSLTSHWKLEAGKSNYTNELTLKEPLVPMLTLEAAPLALGREVQTLPPYDKGKMTRNTCIGGLIFSWLVSIACITLAHWTFKSNQLFVTQKGGYTSNRQGERVFFLSTTCQELVKLAVNICISLSTDCLGYIHSVSTRWALWREDRLLYNSNARLLVSTCRCPSSRWSSNLVSAFLLMMCYASAGQLFLSSTSSEQEGFVLNGVAISALGVGLLGQAMICTLCIWGSRKLMPTWSSNSLNTALTCLHHGMRRVDGRCMLSVHQSDGTSNQSRPLPHQGSARHAMPSIKYITWFSWAFVALTAIWSITVRSNPYFRKSSSATLPLYGNSVPILELNLCALLITTSLQLFLTLLLHLTELLVNLIRDEQIWRLATSKNGTQRSFGALGSLKSAVFSWQTVLLFALKSLAYWLFGLAVNSDGQSVYMNWQGILLLLAGVTVVAAFGSFLAWNQPSGSQPATFGQLQTLVNLIDEWYGEEERMWWGDKGIENPVIQDRKVVRHAGTAKKRLEKVKIGSYYR